MTADQIRSLQPGLAALLERFRRCFKKGVTFRHWQCYLLGLMADLKRKSIEPIALAAGVPVRTLQEFLSQFAWDHDRASTMLQQLVMDAHGCDEAIGVIDGSGHHKQGDKTPGVQRQWCGETGKIDNCVVGQHLLYTDNDAKNPFTCMIASDLYLPKSWDEDRDRCREAGIPDDVTCRPKWRMALDQVTDAIGNGVRFSWLTFDEEYGSVPAFWFGLDQLGQRGIGEVRSNFLCWPTLPKYGSLRGAFAAKRVDNVCRFSPVFRKKKWHRITIKETTRGPAVWEVKVARVYLVQKGESASKPTDRLYWLIIASNPKTSEVKYFVSNAPGNATLQKMMTVAFARWHVEKWFERAKQEAGFGAFEVRTYKSLVRHWLCSRMVMYFLADTTRRLRGEKPADHAGAGGRGNEQSGQQNLEPLLAFMAGDHRTQPVLPGA
jgi:SRSO17 transposase